VLREKTASGKVENLLLVFHFSTRRRGGGNVEIASAISKGCGQRGKPAFGFPRCPSDRHFHGPLFFMHSYAGES
jgi:hypothetical protein